VTVKMRVIDRCITILRRSPHLINPQQGGARLITSDLSLVQVMVHSLALAPVLAVVPQKLHSHVHVHVVSHPLPLEVRVQMDRSFGIVMVVGIACYSVLSHQLSLLEREYRKEVRKGRRSGRTMRSMLWSHIWIVKLRWGSSLALTLTWMMDIWVMVHVMLWMIVHSWSRTGRSVWYRSMWRTSIWTEHEWWS
jgi:hypothetical protein